MLLDSRAYKGVAEWGRRWRWAPRTATVPARGVQQRGTSTPSGAPEDGPPLHACLSPPPPWLSAPPSYPLKDLLVSRLGSPASGVGSKYWAREAAAELAGWWAADEMRALLGAHEGRHLDEGALLLVGAAGAARRGRARGWADGCLGGCGEWGVGHTGGGRWAAWEHSPAPWHGLEAGQRRVPSCTCQAGQSRTSQGVWLNSSSLCLGCAQSWGQPLRGAARGPRSWTEPIPVQASLHHPLADLSWVKTALDSLGAELRRRLAEQGVAGGLPALEILSGLLFGPQPPPRWGLRLGLRPQRAAWLAPAQHAAHPSAAERLRQAG